MTEKLEESPTILLRMDREQTRLYNIKQKLDKSLTVSTSDAKFLMKQLNDVSLLARNMLLFNSV